MLFPDDGITKRELADYYSMVARVMLPHRPHAATHARALSPGIAGQGFIQKNLGRGAPEWLQRVEVPKKDGLVVYPLLDDAASLLWMANQNCITPHVWTRAYPS